MASLGCHVWLDGGHDSGDNPWRHASLPGLDLVFTVWGIDSCKQWEFQLGFPFFDFFFFLFIKIYYDDDY